MTKERALVLSNNAICYMLDNGFSKEHICNYIGSLLEELEEILEYEKEWIVPVTWEMCGFIKVKAKTAVDAFIKVKNDEEDYPLPEEKNYIDGSFNTSFDTEEMIKEYTEMYNRGELKI